LAAAADFLSRMNDQKPFNTMNDDELQALLIQLGMHKIKADMTAIKIRLEKIVDILNSRYN
jgi:hypothetical protein